MNKYRIEAQEIVYYVGWVEAENEDEAKEIFNNKSTEEFLEIVSEADDFKITSVVEDN